MGSDILEVVINAVKIILLFLLIVQLVPLLVWIERRGSAFIQNRLGPNRVGPLGLTQLLADALKFLNKEEFVPAGANKFLFYLAPVIALIPAALAFAAIPMGAPITTGTFELFGSSFGPYVIPLQGAAIPLGVVYILGVSSLASYSLLIAGWGSNSKYSLMGALRASAQMISYELALGLSVVGIILIYGTFDLTEMIAAQSGPLTFHWMGELKTIAFLPNWGVFYQPVGFFLFLCASFAETNRLPFDLPEAEAELVAGYHTEYGGFKMNLFYIGEYGHMIVGSALMAIFYFGGYQIPGLSNEQIMSFLNGNISSAPAVSLAFGLLGFAVMMAKIFVFLWIFIWVRWTLPRFRYDQLMDIGWKTMLPWSLGNIIVTAIAIFLARS